MNDCTTISNKSIQHTHTHTHRCSSIQLYSTSSITSITNTKHSSDTPSSILGSYTHTPTKNETNLLLHLQKETKSTEEHIEKLVSNIDPIHGISQSVIEREIFDAASMLGTIILINCDY